MRPPVAGEGPPSLPPTGLECGSRMLLVPTPWLHCRGQPAGPLNTMCKSSLFLFAALSLARRLGWECGPVNRRGICSLQMKQALSPLNSLSPPHPQGERTFSLLACTESLQACVCVCVCVRERERRHVLKTLIGRCFW